MRATYVQRTILFAALLGMVFLLFGIGHASKRLRAKREIELGQREYRNGNYSSATAHFERALQLDPQSSVNLRLMLAVNKSGPSNATLAIQEYENVLKLDPNRIEAIEGLAAVHLWNANYPEAKRYYVRAVQLNPMNPENFYGAGVVDWRRCYNERTSRRTELNLKLGTPLIHSRACRSLRDQNMPVVEEGMTMFNKALQLRPDYADAMAYLNLMYRERADIQCGNLAAYKHDLRQADDWVDRTMSAKKAAAERAANGIR